MTPPMTLPRRILQVNTNAVHGGAAKIAQTLHNACLNQGLESYLAVQNGNDTLDNRTRSIDNRRYGRPDWLLRGVLQRALGWQDISYPGSHRLSDTFPEGWDILHGHNLHGFYFDLGALPKLARRAPIILTMHDQWLTTGHCAYTLTCDRWRIGCGKCPDLTLYPAIRRDGTHFNWRRKRQLLQQANVVITSPAQSLLDQLDKSLLAGQPRYLVRNGIDTSIFTPADKRAARQALDLPPDRFVLLFVANPNNPFKDFDTVLQALHSLKEMLPPAARPYLLVLGSDAATPTIEQRYPGDMLRVKPFINDQHLVARHYQAADVLLHAAKAEVLPLAILEAMACGCPVVASDVGGINEEIVAGETGLLVTPGDPAAIVTAVRALMNAPKQITLMGKAGRQRILANFTIDHMVTGYLTLYAELHAQQNAQTKRQ